MVAAAWQARRIVRSRCTTSPSRLQVCLNEASAQLGLGATPALATADIDAPVIWCWARRPLILVPRRAGAVADKIDWVGVFRHELAHWRRRDHLAQLLARVVTALFPFHPLAWYAARRLTALSERACDAWAVADGRSSLDYADSLLRLCPQRRPRLALAAVSGRKLLIARVDSLLAQAPAPPRAGRRWLAAAGVFMSVAVAGIALAQPAKRGRQSLPEEARMQVTGQVLLPSGEPAVGAQVAVAGRPKQPSRGGDFSDNDSLLLGLAVADEKGQFSVEVQRTNSAAFWDLYTLAALVGYGRVLTPLDRDAASPSAVVQLAKGEVLRAKLIDLQGQPAAGVELFVETIGIPGPGRIEGVSFRSPPERLTAWPRRLKSDEHGRIALDGFDRQFAVTLTVDDLRYARQWLLLGAPTKDVEEPTITLPPSQIIEGRVTYADTGEPARRARLTVYASENEYGGGIGVATEADENGHFVVNPYAGAYMEITAYAAVGAPYLTTHKVFKWPRLTTKRQLDVALPRGVLARGKVVEKQTGTPIAGAGIEYVPSDRNLNKDDSLVFGWSNMGLSDSRGEFALPVLAGEGHLLIKGPGGDFIHQEIGDRLLDRGQPGGRRLYPDAVVPLDVPRDKPSVDVDASLQRGVVVKGRLVGPAGEAVRHALMICRLQIPAIEFYWRFPTEMVDGNFELHGLDPDRSYPVLFLDSENQWGAATTLTGRQAGETVTVRLLPCGTASGRFLGPDGKPLKQFRPSPELVVTPGVSQYDTKARGGDQLLADAELLANVDRRNYWTGPITDDEGRAVFPALIPGATYRFPPFKTGAQHDFTAECGQHIELPDLTVPVD